MYRNKRYSSSLGETHPSIKFPSFHVYQTSSGQLLGSSKYLENSIGLLFQTGAHNSFKTGHIPTFS
jgi:hypothetical protein